MPEEAAQRMLLRGRTSLADTPRLAKRTNKS
eukprot:SAG11_NODE_2647_length_3132_cov_3.280910_4_plen_30_part_01